MDAKVIKISTKIDAILKKKIDKCIRTKIVYVDKISDTQLRALYNKGFTVFILK